MARTADSSSRLFGRHRTIVDHRHLHYVCHCVSSPSRLGSASESRTYTRNLTRSTSVPCIDALFPHAAQLIRTRTDRMTGKRSREVVYAVTSLDHYQADPGLVADWLQQHWGVENRVHYVRDVTH